MLLSENVVGRVVVGVGSVVVHHWPVLSQRLLLNISDYRCVSPLFRSAQPPSAQPTHQHPGPSSPPTVSPSPSHWDPAEPHLRFFIGFNMKNTILKFSPNSSIYFTLLTSVRIKFCQVSPILSPGTCCSQDVTS